MREGEVLLLDRSPGHGRRDTRVIKVLTVADLGFPHARQVTRITSLSLAQASPQRLALIVRGHWVHHIRDVTFGEDASKIWTGHGPENMATLRNLAHGRLRDVGHDSIAARREMSYNAFTAPLDLRDVPA